MTKRPPIVVIIGSVDHGKTTLLDYIRKTNVAAKEAGGITQSVGAYEILHPSTGSTSSQPSPEATAGTAGQAAKITFIDTPGHEAFSKMKARGAKIADIAILVVAADDGVQPQTKAAIKIIVDAKIPFIVAINKIDKQGVDINRVKNELMQSGVMLEGYGGNISNQEISAKTGQNVNDLLDLILLTAEVENLTYNPDAAGKGFVLETKRDGRRGIVATLIVKDGTLKLGDAIAAGAASGKVKILENFLGKSAKELVPSSPALVVGFETLPRAGDEFSVGELKSLPATRSKIAVIKADEKKDTVNIILKADVSGSLEALSEITQNLPRKERQKINIVDEGVGDVTDGDVNLAISTGSLIIGFRTAATKPAEILARAKQVKIIQSEIIYDLVKAIEEALLGLERKIVRGKLEILAMFGRKGGNQIIGGKVTEGVISNNAVLEIERAGVVAGSGKIINLQQGKKDAKSVPAGNECGLLFNSAIEIKIGDALIAR